MLLGHVGPKVGAHGFVDINASRWFRCHSFLSLRRVLPSCCDAQYWWRRRERLRHLAR